MALSHYPALTNLSVKHTILNTCVRNFVIHYDPSKVSLPWYFLFLVWSTMWHWKLSWWILTVKRQGTVSTKSQYGSGCGTPRIVAQQDCWDRRFESNTTKTSEFTHITCSCIATLALHLNQNAWVGKCQTGLAPNHMAAILTEAACFHVERLLDVVADLGSAVVSSQLHKVQNNAVLQVSLKHKHRQYRWWGLISRGTVA